MRTGAGARHVPPSLVAVLLLLPICLLPPLPIDETRYLAVAWEMRSGGDWLVPHLNGAAYADKPPLLFWLINAGWLLTGVHAFTARLLTLGCSLASLFLLGRLALRLSGSPRVAWLAQWFLLGSVLFAAFADAIMFDVALATCVLAAVHGIVDLADDRRLRGLLLTAAAIGLGILTKGPVMLLHLVCLALAAPWWQRDRLRGRRVAYYALFVAALLIGATVALAWAIPAALHGGGDYARAILLDQTVNRVQGVQGTGAHARPWWWYAAVLPLLLMPWPIVLRGSVSSLRVLAGNMALRLAAAWFLPTLLVFSLVAGKQAHYLLPLLPAVALALASALASGALRLRPKAWGWFLIALGAACASLLHWTPRVDLELAQVALVIWGAAIAGIGLLLLAFERRGPLLWSVVATLLLVASVRLMISLGAYPNYDVRAAAALLVAAEGRGQLTASIGPHHGAYEFAGRLQRPVPVLNGNDNIGRWVAQNPDGILIGFRNRYGFCAQPLWQQPFRGGTLRIWSARALARRDFVSPEQRAPDCLGAGAEVDSD